MSMWEILGIYETTNVQVIKKAFASKSKECHPEERPEEFKQLRNAYKEAMKCAKINANNCNESDSNSSSEKASENLLESKYVSFDFSENLKVQKEREECSTKADSPENVSDRPKSLFERMHGEKPATANDRDNIGGKPKSLYERMHGEALKIERQNEKVKPKSLYERMHTQEKSEKEKKDDAEFNFDYIVDDRQIQKYISDFQVIFSNPFLRNNNLFWEYYLNNNWNGALLKNNYVADKLVDEMCKYDGWFEMTLKKLEEKLKISLERVRNKKVKIQEMATAYQRGYDNFIMEQVEKNGFEKNLNNEDSIKCYFAIYLKMIQDKRIRI